MGSQTLLKTQLTEELEIVFKARISHLNDEIGRRKRTPYRDPGVQKVELAKFNYKLSVAIIALDQLLDLIRDHVHV